MYRSRRRYEEPESASLDRWLVSYADYVTLMFALFVVLYSLAITKEEKFKTISSSLAQVFEKPVAAQTGVKGPDLLTDNQPKSDYQQFGTSLETATGPELVADAKEQPTLQKPQFGNPLVSLQNQLTQSLANLIEKGVAKVENDQDWLTIQLNSGLLFPSGSGVQTASASVLLTEIVAILNQSNNIIRVRGYTDNQAMSNEIYASNWELSMARATAILRELQRLGVQPERMAAEGYGEFAPFADNATAAGRAENRKVVIAISKFATRPASSQPSVSEATSLEQAEQMLQQQPTTAADDGTIKVIRLPHGGIKITSDATVQSEQKKNNGN
jgi:chemotaxis protein MotB